MCAWLLELVPGAMIFLNQKGIPKLAQLMGKALSSTLQTQFSTAIEQPVGLNLGCGTGPSKTVIKHYLSNQLTRKPSFEGLPQIVR